MGAQPGNPVPLQPTQHGRPTTLPGYPGQQPSQTGCKTSTQVYDQANQANQMNYSQPNYVNDQPNYVNNQPNYVSNQPNQVQVHYQPNQTPPQTGDWKYGLCDCATPAI